MAFSHSPEQAVGKSIFTEVGKSLVVNLEGGDVGFGKKFSILDFYMSEKTVKNTNQTW